MRAAAVRSQCCAAGLDHKTLLPPAAACPSEPHPYPSLPPPCRGICGVSCPSEGRPSHPSPHPHRRHCVRRRYWSQRHHCVEGKQASRSCCLPWLHPSVWLLTCLDVQLCHTACVSRHVPPPPLPAPSATPRLTAWGSGVRLLTAPHTGSLPLQGIESDEAGSDEGVVKGDIMQFLHFGAPRCVFLHSSALPAVLAHPASMISFCVLVPFFCSSAAACRSGPPGQPGGPACRF